jgi:peptidyl-tRNA hydrolase, PTH1 family
VAYLIVGLGNPGREYSGTRHNVGFMAIDCLCQDLGIRITRMQSRALVGNGLLEGNKVILAKPQTFMNLSGQAVSGLVKFYKVELEELIVIHDDIDLPLGTIRLKPSGGSAGQKGLASTMDYLGTNGIPRLRIGLGRPPGRMEAADYVLQNFAAGEREILTEVLDRVAKAVQVFILNGIEAAMTQFNGALPER